ncbi:MAG: bifunctional glycosyltransferase family 2/GtrA family protein [Deltaproteobacteria bacterium]|nr:bifunctional glycosyltransferase family 2/GtrA family protein [Deltaproteobacteria bacterium]
MNKLSIVIPCYNEERTLAKCVETVLRIADASLALELIIVDDCSTDNSLSIAHSLAHQYTEIKILHHTKNQGKGAALRTGFQGATGDFVAVQDADLEYDPFDLKRLLTPLIEDKADVVLGSRFLSGGAHRVLYFWHSLGNRFLTLLSNMFTDLNLTDMETCYKVFKREVIQAIDIRENRFGFEPEIIAKIAAKRLRIYEMGVSYYGRTYQEGKKIGVKDGFRALYCIFRYNASHAPLPIQFLLYLFVGGLAALINLLTFSLLLKFDTNIFIAIATSFIIAATVNYVLCIFLIFRHKARWNIPLELLIFILVATTAGGLDMTVTLGLIKLGTTPLLAKAVSCAIGLIFNFLGRRFLVFPEKQPDDWKVSF